MHEPQLRPGAAIIIARLWVTFLVALGFVQLYFVLRDAHYVLTDALGFALFRITLVTVALRILVVAVALYLLTCSRSRRSLVGVVAAMLFFEPISEILMRFVMDYVAMGELRLRIMPIRGYGVIFISMIVTMFLLLSERSNAIYGLKMRQQFADGTPRFWRVLRGRQLFE